MRQEKKGSFNSSSSDASWKYCFALLYENHIAFPSEKFYKSTSLKNIYTAVSVFWNYGNNSKIPEKATDGKYNHVLC